MTTPILRDKWKRKSSELFGDETIIPETPDTDVISNIPSKSKRNFSQENIIEAAERFNDDENSIETQHILLVKTNDEEITSSPTKCDTKENTTLDENSTIGSEQLFVEVNEAKVSKKNLDQFPLSVPTMQSPHVNIDEIIVCLTSQRTQSSLSYTPELNQLSTDAIIALHSEQCQFIDTMFEDVAISM